MMNEQEKSIFKPIFLAWDGKEYKVEPDRVMMLIATVEQVVSLTELSRPNPPLAKIAMAYAAALQYAGARHISGEKIYATYFTKDAKINIPAAITGLLMLMIPPDDIVAPGTTEPKKPKRPIRKSS